MKEVKVTINFELIGEGKQVSKELIGYFGNVKQVYEHLSNFQLSDSSIDQYFRRMQHDPNSKFIKVVENILGKTYESFIYTIESQLQDVMNKMMMNIDYLDSKIDADTAKLIDAYCNRYGKRQLQIRSALLLHYVYCNIGKNVKINEITDLIEEAKNLELVDLVLLGIRTGLRVLLEQNENERAVEFSLKHGEWFAIRDNEEHSLYLNLLALAHKKNRNYKVAADCYKSASNLSALQKTSYLIAAADCLKLQNRHKDVLKIRDMIDDVIGFNGPGEIIKLHAILAESYKNRRLFQKAENHLMYGMIIRSAHTNISEDCLIELYATIIKCGIIIPNDVLKIMIDDLPALMRCREFCCVKEIFDGLLRKYIGDKEVEKLLLGAVIEAFDIDDKGKGIVHNKADVLDVYIHVMKGRIV